MHEGPVALNIVARSRGFADQHAVGSWGGADTDAEQGIEGK